MRNLLFLSKLLVNHGEQVIFLYVKLFSHVFQFLAVVINYLCITSRAIHLNEGCDVAYDSER